MKDEKLFSPGNPVLDWLAGVMKSSSGVKRVRVNDDSQVEFKLKTPLGEVTVLMGVHSALKALDSFEDVHSVLEALDCFED